MSDIEQRLRAIDEVAMYEAPATTEAIIREAADELARLEADNASLRSKLEESEGALEKCQRVLAMLTDPNPRSDTNVTNAWAQCVEAELVARRTLASLREADHA